MAISFVAEAHAALTTAGTSITCAVPTGTQDGDVMLAIILADNIAQHGAIVPPGGGAWTLVDDIDIANPHFHQSHVYTRIASSEPADYAWTVSSNGALVASITTWRGVDAATPVEAIQLTQDPNLNTTFECAGVTTLTDGAVAVYAYGVNEGAVANQRIPVTPDANTTKRSEAQTVGITIGNGLAVCSEARPTAGATGARNATSANLNGRNIAWGLSLKPDLNQTATLSAAGATAAALDPAVSLGGITASVPAAQAAAEAHDADASLSLTVSLSPATAAATGLDAATSLGGITANLTRAEAQAVGLDVDGALGGITAALSPALASAVALDVDVVTSGTVVLGVAEATAAGHDVSLQLALVVPLSAAVATAAGLDPDVVTGALVVPLSPAQASAVARDVGISLEGTVTLSPAQAAAVALDAAGALALTIPLSPAEATAQGIDAGATLGGITVALTPAIAQAIAHGPHVTLGALVTGFRWTPRGGPACTFSVVPGQQLRLTPRGGESMIFSPVRQ